jgi:hypothetical protein
VRSPSITSSIVTRPFAPLFVVALAACGAAPDPAPAESTAKTEERWDSQDGNPTHATHSYLTEYAANQLQSWYPDLVTYRATLVDGANREIHDLVLSDPEQEALRQEVVGTNAGCMYPDRMWNHVVQAFNAGNVSKAYWYLGILLHYVEDIGVPAHAFGVYHQASPSNWDDFEVMALQGWYPSYSNIDRGDPWLSVPSDYVAWNKSWTIADWQQTFPGVTYYRTYYATSWWWASSRQKTYMENRQGRTAVAASYALYSAMRALYGY